MEDLMEKMTTNIYKTLEAMYDCQITLANGEQYIPTSQAELARIIGVSAITMNSYFKYFSEQGLVDSYNGMKGKYRLSDTSIVIIETMKKLDKKLEGER